MSAITFLALLVFLVIPEASSAIPLTISGISFSDQGLNRCQCITKERRFIGRLIGTVQVIQPTSHCKEMELIATLKNDGRRICLDPKVPWVKKTFERQQAQHLEK